MSSADEILAQTIAAKREQRALAVSRRQQLAAAQQEFGGSVLGWEPQQQAYRVQLDGGREVLAQSVQSKAPGARVTVSQRGGRYWIDYL